MILVIGEVLFDIFPEYERLGGAPFNFVYHLKKFGFPVRFISRIGNDERGRKIKARIKEAGFEPTDIQVDDSHPTGTVQVHLDRAGVPEFDIVSDVAYDYIDLESENCRKYFQDVKIVYFGTLVQRTGHGFNQMQHFLRRKPSKTIAFCDLNLRPDCYSRPVIRTSLMRTDILKLNTDELQMCKHIAGFNQDNTAFIRNLMAQYSLEVVALTKGKAGSELHTKSGSSRWTPPPLRSIADTVGAGDGYAAILAAGILKKWPRQQILKMATDFASQICSVQGAIPESDDFYLPIRKYINNGE